MLIAQLRNVRNAKKGDSVTNARRDTTTDFICANGLTLLSEKLCHTFSRWTWKSPLGRSVVDLAMVSALPCSFLEIIGPSTQIPHQMVVVTLATHVD
jgi:hypothetical protein